MAGELTFPELMARYPIDTWVELEDHRVVQVVRFYRCRWSLKMRLEFRPIYTETLYNCPVTGIVGPALAPSPERTS